MFIIGLWLLAIVAYKQDSLTLEVHKTIGWVITFVFAIGWLRMIQIFYKNAKEIKRIIPEKKAHELRIKNRRREDAKKLKAAKEKKKKNVMFVKKDETVKEVPDEEYLSDNVKGGDRSMQVDDGEDLVA